MGISDWSSDVCSSDLRIVGSPSKWLQSGHTDRAHHPAGLVSEDVAVEHQVTRVISDDGDLDALVRCAQDSVLPFPVRGGYAVPGDPPEDVAVPVERVPQGGPDATVETEGRVAPEAF